MKKISIAAVLFTVVLFQSLTASAAQKETYWMDPLEIPQLANLDVKYLGVTGSNGNYTVRIGFYGKVPEKFVGNIYLNDFKAGTGVDSGPFKGADLLISFYPPNLCNAMPYDPLKKGFSQTTFIKCSSEVRGDEVIVKLPNVKALGFPETFGIKAVIWSSISDDLGSGVYTLSPTKVEPKVDGKMDEWKHVPPIIIDENESMPKAVDFKEFYGLVKKVSFYFAAVPYDRKLMCDIKGRGADIEWYLNLGIDADMNPNTGLNGKEEGAGFLYSCGWDGRVWAYIYGFPTYFYTHRYGNSAAGEVLEGSIPITPIYPTIMRNKKFEVTVSILTRVKDRIPDSGWMLVGSSGLKISEFTITGSKADMEMSSDLISKFKGKGESTKVVRLGGPKVNDKYNAPISFIKNSQGLYAGIEVNGRKYWSTYGSVDFAVVDVKKLSQGYEITVAGITRYGTKAGLMWLIEHQNFINQGTYVLSWFDDGDGIVELSEIGEVLAP